MEAGASLLTATTWGIQKTNEPIGGPWYHETMKELIIWEGSMAVLFCSCILLAKMAAQVVLTAS